MSHSIPQAKNCIRKTLWRLVDKEPSTREITVLWAYFSSECAYCGRKLSKVDRNGHLDHLEANLAVGRNHISNRVLACNICNGDEKRETDWEQFLARKCGDDEAAYVIRHSRITEWRKQCGPPLAFDPAILAQVQSSVEACNKLLDEECKRIRRLLALPQTKA
jgi:5-methylcytosine-specific restriction endonuclease McrA